MLLLPQGFFPQNPGEEKFDYKRSSSVEKSATLKTISRTLSHFRHKQWPRHSSQQKLIQSQLKKEVFLKRREGEKDQKDFFCSQMDLRQLNLWKKLSEMSDENQTNHYLKCHCMECLDLDFLNDTESPTILLVLADLFLLCSPAIQSLLFLHVRKSMRLHLFFHKQIHLLTHKPQCGPR